MSNNIDYEINYYFSAPGFNVVAAGDKELHQQALDSLKLN